MPLTINTTRLPVLNSSNWSRLTPAPVGSRNDPSLEIPPKENAPSLPPPAPAATKAALTPAPSPPTKVEAPKVAATAPPPRAEAAPKLEGFAVQVGAFRDEDKLKQARDKLAAAGIAHFIERRGELTRLRAGPYPTREAADKALAAVKAAALEGQVVPLP